MGCVFFEMGGVGWSRWAEMGREGGRLGVVRAVASRIVS